MLRLSHDSFAYGYMVGSRATSFFCTSISSLFRIHLQEVHGLPGDLTSKFLKPQTHVFLHKSLTIQQPFSTEVFVWIGSYGGGRNLPASFCSVLVLEPDGKAM